MQLDYHNEMRATLEISQKELDRITDLTHLPVAEICEKYGNMKGQTISHSTFFPDGVEGRVSVWIPPQDDYNPISDYTLYRNGNELAHTIADEKYAGEWRVIYNNTLYVTTVMGKE